MGDLPRAPEVEAREARHVPEGHGPHGLERVWQAQRRHGRVSERPRSDVTKRAREGHRLQLGLLEGPLVNGHGSVHDRVRAPHVLAEGECNEV